MAKYTLIDGAFFEGICREYGNKNAYDIFENIMWGAVRDGAIRVIYYDALPVKKESQPQEDFDKSLNDKMSLFNRIRRCDGFHVRDGITRLRTKKRQAGISQIYEQKGVDTWIAVDAMQYSMRGIADQIHVYTSDSDLYPLFEALQQTNCTGVLHYQEGRTREELIFSADVAKPITLSEMKQWAPNAIPDHFNRLENALAGAQHVEIYREATPKGNVVLEADMNSKNFYVCREVNGVRQDGTYSVFPMILIDRARGWGASLDYGKLEDLEHKAKLARSTKQA